ncbi:hypothetical protein CMO86_08195 [Candidatus Woesearchaeota archaeon]|jgi:GR25 family glycosyltransferase involved in LPS biosynthesis|nr:hypothetical protein [Candidatus Woesearchaeota archaeon]|tara:strand:- start:5857 stop:6552 length:696 start_codon:yes stop_codon:yes gene_type:complete
MKAYAIVVKDSQVSEKGYENLVQSSKSVGNKFKIKKFDAVTPRTVDNIMIESEVKWNYPWEGEITDFATGLTKKAYPTKDKRKRMACAMSHFSLWQQAFHEQEPILILEHDSMFTNRLDFDIMDTKFNILGINNPLMATRKAHDYYDKIVKSFDAYQLAPYIDPDIKIPQGLAGNSSYIVTPNGAERLISLTYNHGLWPNDAIMCRQLVDKLGVTRKFYTRVQGLPSTTTL